MSYFSTADAIDQHRIRLMWADGWCVAFTYPPGRANAISAGGDSVQIAVNELLELLRAFEQRAGERRSAAKVQPSPKGDAYAPSF